MNCVAKGNRRQNEVRHKLESEGWQVYVAPRIKFGPIDIFGLWDVIAYKEGKFLLIQVKSNICPKSVQDAIRAFKTDGAIVRRQIWVYKDYSRSNPWITEINE